ncbi:MJ0042-type zinc finger domain-containing protein [Hyphomonas sp.]|uniref:MJ0042-type zinc finger domain-containing protein n=1 Tax=Hyphomonas sp. TaxID=87 RepID=UPI00391AA79D
MILTCPSCSTHYFADDSTIGESGRTVKCASCGHSWFVRPAGDDTEREPPPPPHELYRERMRERRREKSRLAAALSWVLMALVFVGLTAAAFFFRSEIVRVWPQSAGAYRLFGLEVNRFGLDFEGQVVTRTFNDTVPIVTITGRVVNVSQAAVDAPGVRIDLRDERGAVVATRYSLITPIALQPGEAGQFGAVIEPAPNEAFDLGLSFVELSEVPPLPPAGPVPDLRDMPPADDPYSDGD